MNEVQTGRREGGIVMRRPDTFGLPPKERPGSILRQQVPVAIIVGALPIKLLYTSSRECECLRRLCAWSC